MESKTLLVLVLLVKLCISQCPDWSYSGKNGPANWSTLCPEYAECGGTEQSPINIVTLSSAEYSLYGNYLKDTATMNLSNTTLVVEDFQQAAGSVYYITESTSERYYLDQIFFHTPSEHTFNSQQFDLEVQFYNNDPDSQEPNYAMLSVLYTVDEDASKRVLSCEVLLEIEVTICTS